MAGRFNKLLEFIGLVDDEPEEELDQGGARPVGGQTYGAPNRRPIQQAAPPRQVRGEYEDSRAGRNTSSARPDYDARQRRSDYAPQGQPSRYASDYRSHQQADRPDYTRGDYAQPAGRGGRADYQSRSDYQSGSYRQPKSDPLAEEFERATSRQSREPERGRASVVPMTPVRSAEPSRQTVIYYLRQLEECRDVINDLLDNKTVLLNLEDMDERIVQRAIDTLCGAAFALGATLRKASDKTYLIAPNTVEVASTNDVERRYS